MQTSRTAQLVDFLRGFELRSTGKWFVLSALIGIVAGLGAIVFQFASQAVLHFALAGISGYAPREPAGEHAIFERHETGFSPWLILPVIIAGGLASGAIVYSLAPEAEGHGTDAAIDSFHNKRGQIRGRIPIIKLISSAITIGTGGSGGREGPIAQIGAGFGSFLATRLNLSARERRIMLAAGMGAGVGAIFRAPLAGALFAAEIMYKDADLESDVIVPAAISSIIGYSVFALSLPKEKQFDPLFGRGLDYALGSVFELLPLTLLAVILVLAGIVYIKTFYGVHKLFQKVPTIPHIRPAIGAGMAGMFGLGLYFVSRENMHALAVLSTGYGSLQVALSDSAQIGIPMLLMIAFGKILTTSLTISSGGSGGVFGPSMVIGGCLGAAVGSLFHQLWPSLVPHSGAYAIVGMAGFFAGCAHAPISTIIMVSEMTGNYTLLLPTMWVSTLCFLMCRRWTLYTKQVPSRLDSPAHRGDFLVDVLEGIKVRDVPYKARQTVPEGMNLEEILHRMSESTQRYFPVTDESERVVGIFASDDIRAYLYNQTIWRLAVARDIMTTRIVSVSPEDDLHVALKRFTQLNLDELPVFDPGEPGKLLGMLRRKDTIAVYNQRLMDHKNLVDQHQ